VVDAIVPVWINPVPNCLADRRDDIVGAPASECTGNQLTGSQSQLIHGGLVDDLDVLNLTR
jgi:hypothetical protein